MKGDLDIGYYSSQLNVHNVTNCSDTEDNTGSVKVKRHQIYYLLRHKETVTLSGHVLLAQ